MNYIAALAGIPFALLFIWVFCPRLAGFHLTGRFCYGPFGRVVDTEQLAPGNKVPA